MKQGITLIAFSVTCFSLQLQKVVQTVTFEATSDG